MLTFKPRQSPLPKKSVQGQEGRGPRSKEEVRVGYLCWCRPAPAAQCTHLWSQKARTSSGRPHLSAASPASPQRASGLLGDGAQEEGRVQGLPAAFQLLPGLGWAETPPSTFSSSLELQTSPSLWGPMAFRCDRGDG